MMNFFPTDKLRKKPRFELHLKIYDMNNVPLVAGLAYIKWSFAHSISSEHRGRTARVPIVHHRAHFHYAKRVSSFRIGVDKSGQLADCMLEFEVLQDFPIHGGASSTTGSGGNGGGGSGGASTTAGSGIPSSSSAGSGFRNLTFSTSKTSINSTATANNSNTSNNSNDSNNNNDNNSNNSNNDNNSNHDNNNSNNHSNSNTAPPTPSGTNTPLPTSTSTASIREERTTLGVIRLNLSEYVNDSETILREAADQQHLYNRKRSGTIASNTTTNSFGGLSSSSSFRFGHTSGGGGGGGPGSGEPTSPAPPPAPAHSSLASPTVTSPSASGGATLSSGPHEQHEFENGDQVQPHGIVQRYLLQDSKVNCTVKISILMVQTGGDRNYTAPPLRRAPVFSGVAGLFMGEGGDPEASLPSFSVAQQKLLQQQQKQKGGDEGSLTNDRRMAAHLSQSPEVFEVLDVYRQTLAASWISQPGELPADECIEDIFNGGNGWGTGHHHHSHHYNYRYKHNNNNNRQQPYESHHRLRHHQHPSQYFYAQRTHPASGMPSLNRRPPTSGINHSYDPHNYYRRPPASQGWGRSSRGDDVFGRDHTSSSETDDSGQPLDEEGMDDEDELESMDAGTVVASRSWTGATGFHSPTMSTATLRASDRLRQRPPGLRVRRSSSFARGGGYDSSVSGPSDDVYDDQGRPSQPPPPILISSATGEMDRVATGPYRLRSHGHGGFHNRSASGSAVDLVGFRPAREVDEGDVRDNLVAWTCRRT